MYFPRTAAISSDFSLSQKSILKRNILLKSPTERVAKHPCHRICRSFPPPPLQPSLQAAPGSPSLSINPLRSPRRRSPVLCVNSAPRPLFDFNFGLWRQAEQKMTLKGGHYRPNSSQLEKWSANTHFIRCPVRRSVSPPLFTSVRQSSDATLAHPFLSSLPPHFSSPTFPHASDSRLWA